MRIIVNENNSLPEGVYPVRLVGIREQDGQFGKQIIWLMEVTAGEYKNRLLRGWTNLSSAISSKTVRWCSAFADRQFQTGEEIDISKLIGRQASAKVERSENARGEKYTKVVDVYRKER